MGSFDAVMFGVEQDPLLRSVIVLIAILDSAPDRTVIADRAQRLTRVFPKLRQRAVGNSLSPAPPRWETDPNFDFDYHLTWRRSSVRQAPIDEVLRFAERMSEQDFDRSRPLWEVAIMTDLIDGQAAFIVKIHHSITDGMGGMAMAANLFDISREPADLGPMPDEPVAHPSGMADRVAQSFQFELNQIRDEAVTAASYAASAVRKTVTDPVGTTMSAGKIGLSAASMLAPQGKPLSDLMTDRSLSVNFALIDVSLADLKRAATTTGTTLNTAFMATVTAALRSYHEQCGHELAEFRVNMPINVRTEDDEAGGNHWVPARFTIPVADVDAAQRLLDLQPVLVRAQRDPALRLSTIVYRLLTMLPRQVTTSIAGSLMKGVDVAATNVPGPPIPIYLAGSLITTLVPFAPKSGAAVNIGLMSYAGTVYIGINSDPAAVTHPELLADCFRAALAEISAIGRVAES